jgi:hypothetical protein
MKIASLAAVAAIVSASIANAAISIDVGSHNLFADTPDQKISLFVTGDELVTGFSLRAQIGDGTGPNAEPVFSSVHFTPAIWDAFANSTIGGPDGGAEQFAEAGVLFDNSGNQVLANGHLLDLTVSTVGITSGTFDLLLSSTEIGVGSAFILTGGDERTPDITNGSINIVVPEPATIALATPAVLLLRRRKRSV